MLAQPSTVVIVVVIYISIFKIRFNWPHSNSNLPCNESFGFVSFSDRIGSDRFWIECNICSTDNEIINVFVRFNDVIINLVVTLFLVWFDFLPVQSSYGMPIDRFTPEEAHFCSKESFAYIFFFEFYFNKWYRSHLLVFGIFRNPVNCSWLIPNQKLQNPHSSYRVWDSFQKFAIFFSLR